MVAILWEKDSPRRVRLSELVANEQHPVLLKTERQISEYFAGKRKTFSIALDMRGTRFQKDVWEALLAIPFGETRSYGQLAQSVLRTGEIQCQSSCRVIAWLERPGSLPDLRADLRRKPVC